MKKPNRKKIDPQWQAEMLATIAATAHANYGMLASVLALLTKDKFQETKVREATSKLTRKFLSKLEQEHTSQPKPEKKSPKRKKTS
jgi:acyl-CoA reductase-like NAD-dependent aldehyde dehydrogenase